MNLRTRILLTSLTAALVPFLLLTVAIRKEAGSRLAVADAAHARSAATRIEGSLDVGGDRINRSLHAIAAWIREDADLRRSLDLLAAEVADPDEHRMRGLAASMMELSRLSFLELLDGSGRIVSSGHFRQDYGRHDDSMLLIPAGSLALVEVRRPEGTALGLARRHAFSLAGREYTLVGGVAPAEVLPWVPPETARVASQQVPSNATSSRSESSSRLMEPDALAASGREVLVTVVRSGENPPPDALRMLSIAYLPENAGRPETASLVFLRTEDPTAQLRQRLDRWLVGALAASLVASFALASLLAEYVARPIRDLAEKTTRVQLWPARSGLDSERRDEVGELSRFLASMVERLRHSARQLQDAERRAALGDLARQVNHDVRGGVAPIRHVVRHLSSLAGDPQELAQVYRERQRTLEEGLSYLEDLATRYAKLSPRPELRSVDLRAVIDQVVTAMPVSGGARLAVEGASSPVWVRGDPLGLRRIVENLVQNALEALPEGRGEVILTLGPSANGSQVTFRVRDTGVGIPEADRERVFEPFFSTRDRGTGLGLGIVRRLVMDCEGRIDLESEPGRGTTMTVVLSAAEPPTGNAATHRDPGKAS